MENFDYTHLDQVQDIESHNIYALATKLHIPKSIRWKMIRRTSRDNGRTPMQWTDGPNAGFTSGKPWLQVNGNYSQVNVQREEQDENGVLAFWRYMISLRKTHPVLIDGEFVPVYMGKSVFAYERVLDGKRLLAVLNMCGKRAKLPAPLGDWTSVVASNYDTLSSTHLQPFEFRLMEE